MTVVALLSANCGYSRRHAVKLSRLAASLEAEGLNVKFLGINARYRAAHLMASELNSLINFTVYQSEHRSTNYWSLIGGLKDDVFVYDSCGRLAYYVPFPRSFIPFRFVELAIRGAATGDGPCGPPLSNSNNQTLTVVRVRPLQRHRAHHGSRHTDSQTSTDYL